VGSQWEASVLGRPNTDVVVMYFDPEVRKMLKMVKENDEV
jgi:hypothetical protein